MIPESTVKNQYFWHKGEIIGYSFKAGSTSIANITRAGGRRNQLKTVDRIPQQEAYEARLSGVPVNLWVRHPLERLVSCYVYFTTKNISYLSVILKDSPEDHAILLGLTSPKPTFEEWYRASQRHYNSHWIGQTEYHTRNGILVPDTLWPIESLTEKHNVTKKRPWEEYIKGSLREELETQYAADTELYLRAKEEWNGQTPSILHRTT